MAGEGVEMAALTSGLPASSPTAHDPGDSEPQLWRAPTPLQPRSWSNGETEAPCTRRLEEQPPAPGAHARRTHWTGL